MYTWQLTAAASGKGETMQEAAWLALSRSWWQPPCHKALAVLRLRPQHVCSMGWWLCRTCSTAQQHRPALHAPTAAWIANSLMYWCLLDWIVFLGQSGEPPFTFRLCARKEMSSACPPYDWAEFDLPPAKVPLHNLMLQFKFCQMKQKMLLICA